MKAFKSFTALFLVILMMGSLYACNSSENGSTHEEESNALEMEETKEESNALEMEDIAWNVDEGIIDGERYALLDYTNNTDYTIASFEITFTEKSGVTEEEKEAFYTDIKKEFELSDEDLAEIKEQDISMHAESEHIVEAGESSKNNHCFYYSGYYYMKNMDHYELVEPDIATIKYIDDDRIGTAYYDFASEEFSVEDDTVEAYQWTETALGNKIPKPEVKVLEAEIDDDDTFMFYAYGMSLNEFNSYVEECKALGYTADANSFEGFYSADNAEGYNVYLNYHKDDDSMSLTVEAPEQ